MRTHIKVVAIVNIIYSAVGLLKAASVLLGGVLGGLFSGSFMGFVMSGVTSVMMSLVFGAIAVFGLLAGFGLLNHQQWARYVAIVVAIFGLFNFPVGMAFSVYTLWVLFHDETRHLFGTRHTAMA